MANVACVKIKEKNYAVALKCLLSAQLKVGYQPDIAYNIALCYYESRQFSAALKQAAEIIEKGVKEHPGIEP